MRLAGRLAIPAALLAAAWLVSCAAPPPAPPAPARVSLVSYRGQPALAGEGADALPRRVDILVDATVSMARPGAAGRSHVAEAATRAADLMESLPRGTEITLRALGHREQTACGAPERLAGPAIPTLRTAFVRQLDGIAPLGEGSLAGALAEIRGELVRDTAAARTRVVVFSDLELRCGGDLCAEARALAAAGAELELLPLGGATIPACLAALQRPSAPADAVSPTEPPPPPRFHLYAATREDPGLDAPPLGHGRAGEGAVEVPAGMITMVVDLEPPETIGPFHVDPGGAAVVRLLDYPGARPPTRIWRVERAGEPVGRAFPPPEKISEVPE